MICAETMKELIDSKLPEWLTEYKKDLRLLKKTKNYKLYKDSFLEEERKSGWYYDC